jgi:hypothetical protein
MEVISQRPAAEILLRKTVELEKKRRAQEEAGQRFSLRQILL